MRRLFPSSGWRRSAAPATGCMPSSRTGWRPHQALSRHRMLTTASHRAALGPRMVLALSARLCTGGSAARANERRRRVSREQFAFGEPFMGIRDPRRQTPGLSFAWMALRWSSSRVWPGTKTKKVLYALSDHGAVFHVRLDFDEDTLNEVEFMAAFALRDPQGAPLAGARRMQKGSRSETTVTGSPATQSSSSLSNGSPRVRALAPTGIWQQHLPASASAERPRTDTGRGTRRSKV